MKRMILFAVCFLAAFCHSENSPLGSGVIKSSKAPLRIRFRAALAPRRMPALFLEKRR